MEFFKSERQPLGEQTVVLRLDELELALLGLDSDLAGRLRERFGRFVTPGPTRDDVLSVSVGREEVDYFLKPPDRLTLNRILLRCDGERVRYLGHQVAGWFDTRGGDGQLLLSRGDYERPEAAVENYLRAAVAWRAAERGGALIHAASAVLDGRAYLFYGPSGAGKSTLSEFNRRARVISDDLTLALPGEEGLELVGSPFRGTYTGGEQVLGRFPLAAGFRLVQAPAAEVRPAPRILVFSELVGNLPFVAEAFERRPDLFAMIDRAFRAVPLARLAFRKDDDYWDAIAGAGL